jgi:hypothetical protein
VAANPHRPPAAVIGRSHPIQAILHSLCRLPSLVMASHTSPGRTIAPP